MSAAHVYNDALKPTYLRGDGLMAIALAIYALGALAVGFWFD